MFRLAPPGVTVHFDRMVAHGNTGAHEGQDERNASMLAHLDENVALCFATDVIETDLFRAEQTFWGGNPAH